MTLHFSVSEWGENQEFLHKFVSGKFILESELNQGILYAGRLCKNLGSYGVLYSNHGL